MTSWRDGATQQAQDDLDGLLEAALPFAQQLLEKHGELFPYGISVDLMGEIALAAGDPGLGEQPPSATVVELLVDGFRSKRDGLRAAGIVADVRTPDSDAIRVELEHREGHALVVLLPYRTRRLKRGVDYGALSASPGTSLIW